MDILINDIIYEFLVTVCEEFKACGHLSLDKEKQREFAKELRDIADMLEEESNSEQAERRSKRAVDIDALRFRQRLGLLVRDMDIWLAGHGLKVKK